MESERCSVRLNAVFARKYAAALLVAFSFVSSAAGQTGSSQVASGTAVVDISRVRIANFGRVSPSYYRGAQPQGGDYIDLAALGVKTVINLTSDEADPQEQMMVERAGMKYLAIPMRTHVQPTSSQVAQFLGVLDDPASQPVYVHCVGGKHRTGVMTAVYRMTQHGWTADQAFKEMKEYKFGADFLHPEFKQFVYGYRVAVAAQAPAQAVATTKTRG